MNAPNKYDPPSNTPLLEEAAPSVLPTLFEGASERELLPVGDRAAGGHGARTLDLLPQL